MIPICSLFGKKRRPSDLRTEVIFARTRKIGGYALVKEHASPVDHGRRLARERQRARSDVGEFDPQHQLTHPAKQ